MGCPFSFLLFWAVFLFLTSGRFRCQSTSRHGPALPSGSALLTSHRENPIAHRYAASADEKGGIYTGNNDKVPVMPCGLCGAISGILAEDPRFPHRWILFVVLHLHRDLAVMFWGFACCFLQD